jgi:hypothetical protein
LNYHIERQEQELFPKELMDYISIGRMSIGRPKRSASSVEEWKGSKCPNFDDPVAEDLLRSILPFRNMDF